MRDGTPSAVTLPKRIVEIDVRLHCLGQSLTDMRRWLLRRGCQNQVFHCSRKGAHARIHVEFDYNDAALRDRFQHTFGSERGR